MLDNFIGKCTAPAYRSSELAAALHYQLIVVLYCCGLRILLLDLAAVSSGIRCSNRMYDIILWQLNRRGFPRLFVSLH